MTDEDRQADTGVARGPTTGPTLARTVANTMDTTDAATFVDSVELKVLLPRDRDVIRILAGRRRHARVRRLYLFDTADAALAGAGLVLRMRRRSRGRDDLVVKARARDRRGLGGEGSSWAAPERVELDVLPGRSLWAAELRRPVDPARVAACLAGSESPGSLFTPQQQEYTRAVGQRHVERPVHLDALDVHGPLVVERVAVPAVRFGAAAACLERCTYPDGASLLEFSARCRPAHATRIASAVDRFLDAHGVPIAPTQQTKIDAWVEHIRRAGQQTVD